MWVDGEWAGGGKVYLVRSLNAWEVPDGYGGGCRLRDLSMESSERHADGGGEGMTRVGVL